MVFCFFFPFLKVFINIHKYANEIICISGHGMKGKYLPFTLVRSFIVYDKVAAEI